MFSPLALALALGYFFSGAAAYGWIGHSLTGHLAQALVSEKALATARLYLKGAENAVDEAVAFGRIENIFEEVFPADGDLLAEWPLSRAATWADRIKSNKHYSYSYPWHCKST